MIYKVKVIFNNKLLTNLEGRFNSAYVNEESEVLMLFREESNRDEILHRTIRYAIPLSHIDTLEISPIYEDNGQKICSC